MASDGETTETTSCTGDSCETSVAPATAPEAGARLLGCSCVQSALFYPVAYAHVELDRINPVVLYCMGFRFCKWFSTRLRGGPRNGDRKRRVDCSCILIASSARPDLPASETCFAAVVAALDCAVVAALSFAPVVLAVAISPGAI